MRVDFEIYSEEWDEMDNFAHLSFLKSQRQKLTILISQKTIPKKLRSQVTLCLVLAGIVLEDLELDR
jgi:hypothetical protein